MTPAQCASVQISPAERFPVCCFEQDVSYLLPLALRPQLRVYSHGGPGPAADGLPLSEHQPVCGELPQDGSQAPGV